MKNRAEAEKGRWFERCVASLKFREFEDREIYYIYVDEWYIND